MQWQIESVLQSWCRRERKVVGWRKELHLAGLCEDGGVWGLEIMAGARFQGLLNFRFRSQWVRGLLGKKEGPWAEVGIRRSNLVSEDRVECGREGRERAGH